MATAPGRRTGSIRPVKGKNIKKGYCENHKYFNPDTGEEGDCPKCASKEVQSVDVQRLSDFKCSVCGSKLTPVAASYNIMNIIGICVIGAAVAVFIVGWCLGWWFGGSNEPVEVYHPEQEQVLPLNEGEETPVEIIETPEVNEGTPIQPEKSGVSSDKDIPQPGKTSSSSILGGAATLTKSGGAYTIKFTQPYSLDLGKGSGESIQINPGDIIERADVYHDSVLRAGNLKTTSGEEKYLKGLNVKLR